MEYSCSALLTDNPDLRHGEMPSPRKSIKHGYLDPVPLATFGKAPYFTRACSVDYARTIAASKLSSVTRGPVDLDGSSALRTIGPGPAMSSFSHGLFLHLTPGEKSMRLPTSRNAVDTVISTFTLEHYIVSRFKPAVRGQSMSRPLRTVFVVLVFIPFLFTALLFGLHYWLSTRLIF
ncbi:protein kinase [Trypanosoma rangeli]|uniref:Protein kinase n=1 Tax=Trypanosoma rangeli TaxID=5698 RepID=A0A422N9Z9_TRYRA|nr:protein kinase [Trypanosoma rangeli]RNF02273.1 protein kinase [Trypanosoma rangeli]|eukprot:RNF02273.1 protein kinase [Trypanosoma rangeli]